MKRLGRVNVCGFSYDVVRFTDNEAQKIKGLSEEVLGSFDLHNQTLWVAQQPQEQLLDTLWHESRHAIAEHSGSKEFLARELRLDRNDIRFQEIEETLIRIETPHQISFVKSLAKIKWGK